MKLLTTSQTMVKQINSIGINTSEELIEYLPYRYDIFAYSDEIDLQDKQRVVLLGKVVSNPKLVHTKTIDIITFHFVTSNNKFYSVKFII